MPPRRGAAQPANSGKGDDEKRKIVSVGFPPEMLEEINAYARIMGTSSNDIVRVLVREGLTRGKKSPEFRRRAEAYIQNAYDQVRILTGEDFEVTLGETNQENP